MIQINHEKCNSCGICGHVCPRHITEVVERDNEKVTVISSDRIDLCMGCGHCAAVCPDGAIEVEGLDPKEFKPVGKLEITENQLLAMMEQRRSIRRYKNKPC